MSHRRTASNSTVDDADYQQHTPTLDHDLLSSLPIAQPVTSNETAVSLIESPSPIQPSEGTPSTTAAPGAGVGTRTGTAEATSRHKSTSHSRPQTLLTKALLFYIKVFRVLQPLVSLCAVGTIAPVLSYFHTQTIFPAIQATLYVFTATLACCSLFFGIIYLVGVFFHKPLFWPFTNRHFRKTSKARIGGDLIVCMVFCGLWFLSMVGLVIDTMLVDCGKLTGLETVLLENHLSLKKIKTVCRLEKATFGLAVISWACWMGVLVVLFYGHFWKRRQVLAERLRDKMTRKRASKAGAGMSSAVSADAGAIQTGGSARSNRSGLGLGIDHGQGVSGAHVGSSQQQHQQQQSDGCGCQDTEGEVGLSGVICRYDDDQNSTIRRGGYSNSEAAA